MRDPTKHITIVDTYQDAKGVDGCCLLAKCFTCSPCSYDITIAVLRESCEGRSLHHIVDAGELRVGDTKAETFTMGRPAETAKRLHLYHTEQRVHTDSSTAHLPPAPTGFISLGQNNKEVDSRPTLHVRSPAALQP